LARQKRWTVTCRNDRRLAILTPSLRELQDYCSREKLTGKYMMPGDWRTRTPSTNNYTIDLMKLRQAGRRLGLGHPIQIQFSSHFGENSGSPQPCRQEKSEVLD
jgi:hypothetical protein